MWPVSPGFLATLSTSHTLATNVEVWRDGLLLNASLPIFDGEVTIDASSRVRRVLRITARSDDATWDLLSPLGTQVKPYRGVRFPSGAVEMVPLGVFDVDEQSMSYAADGTLSVTAPDLWARVQRAQFERVRQTSGNAVDDITDLVLEAVPGTTVLRQGTFPARAPTSRWETDRDAAIEALAVSVGVDVSFDALGRLRIRPVPSLSQVPAWTVDASNVLLDASRTRSRQRTYNVVIVKSEAVDGVPPFPPVVVADEDPMSPTFVEGGFGRVPYYYSSPLVRTREQAYYVGSVMLSRVRALAQQLSLTSIVNPALEDGDTLAVIFPPRVGKRRVEYHVVDSVTVPLTPGGTQQVTTRNTRGTGDTPPTDFAGGGRIWADLLENPTWADVLGDYATWADVLADEKVSGL